MKINLNINLETGIITLSASLQWSLGNGVHHEKVVKLMFHQLK